MFLEEEERALRSAGEFREYFDKVIQKRLDDESEITKVCQEAPGKRISLLGFCEVCRKETVFQLDDLYSGENTLNFRERLVCSCCGLNNRQRKIVSQVYKHGPQKKVYMYEQVTSAYKAVRAFAGENVIGSEFVDPQCKSGTVVDGILHEDAQSLSFFDESFDLIISCDVFEHVNDYRTCFTEVFRVLKENGIIIFTLPFLVGRYENSQRAELYEVSPGRLKLFHYLEPVYHGNPMSNDGALVFWDYGWKLLDEIKEIGFMDVYLQPYYSRENGYLGGCPYYFVAKKGKAK